MAQSLHEKLMSQGTGSDGKSATFLVLGTVHKGIITAVGDKPDTDVKGVQRTWPSGEPRPPVMTISIQTDEHDPADADDDGIRVIYAKWKIMEAIQEAVIASGGKFDIGGFLAVQYVGDDHANKKAGQDAPKLYKAAYQPPANPVISHINDAAALAPTAPQVAPAQTMAPAAPVAFDPSSLLPPSV